MNTKYKKANLFFFVFFFKKYVRFSPQSKMGENHWGDLSLELKFNINFLETVQSDILFFLIFYIYI